MKQVAIINIGIGNLSSLENIIRRIGYEAILVDEPSKLDQFTKIILPGVGSFDAGMHRLDERDFSDKLRELAHKGIHILGVCLGMQLLFEKSQEGDFDGLGLIQGNVKRFVFNDNRMKVPHMGWNEVKIQKQSQLMEGLPSNSRFYFVHSYYCHAKDRSVQLCSTQYEFEFDSAVEKGNIFGVQFHPEKSHKFGMKLLKNFMEMSC